MLLEDFDNILNMDKSFASDLLTIVIPSKNEEDYIGNLLKDLKYQAFISGMKIIIADNNSTDNTLDVVEKYKKFLNIQVIQGGTVSQGRNNGARLATTPYILFLDADVRFFSDFEIYDALSLMHYNNLDLVTLTPKNYGKDIRASIVYTVFGMLNKIFTKFFCPFAIGAFFMTRTTTFKTLGMFPEKYETCEDFILSKQYKKEKFRIGKGYFGQDNRRFKKMGYMGMITYMIKNFLNRNNLSYFEKSTVAYWDL